MNFKKYPYQDYNAFNLDWLVKKAQQIDDTAEKSKEAVERAMNAQLDAANAHVLAESAVTAANTAQRRADDAYELADDANTAAGNAQDRADDAYELADDANTAAGAAQRRADDAYELADDANTAAGNAQTSADAANAAVALREVKDLLVLSNTTNVSVNANSTAYKDITFNIPTGYEFFMLGQAHTNSFVGMAVLENQNRVWVRNFNSTTANGSVTSFILCIKR